MALIHQESTFNPDIISNTNDYGLMQINKVNHEWLTEKLGVTNYLNPYENIIAGMHILEDLFNKYENHSKVLMAYNMGEYGASNLWEQGIFQTQYSNKILELAATYEQQISEKEGEI
jgi:soluble lytic murein transglycosylase-like protein